ncbi:MAG TPA: hypothetical protein VG984_01830 [Candidatus Paceibacterota bacterium]|nr:hypothetical protein [Candidatus Paceibacterota bacterium]
MNGPRLGTAILIGLALCLMAYGFRIITATGTVDVRHLLSATDMLVVYVSNPSCEANAGTVCQSDQNMCGQINSGIFLCDGTCSAVTPPDSQCPVEPPPNTGGGGGGGGGGPIVAVTPPTPTPMTPEDETALRCTERRKIGDFNCSGRVDIQDFSILAYWFKRPLTDLAYATGVDLNHDQKATLADFSILAYYWGK